MTYKKIRLGNYIKRSTKNNSNLQYGAELIAGVNTEGIFTTPRGDASKVNLKPYKIVNNGAFVYNPTRFELGSIAYRTEGLCIVSHLYMVFYLNEEGKKIIDPTYLYIYLRRKEFQREIRFRNFGSQRPEFNFNDISDIEIPLPNMDSQRKYVAIYNALAHNQKSYERGLEDLKTVCEGIYSKYSKHNSTNIGSIITVQNKKNFDLKYGRKNLRGINEQGEFTSTRDGIRDEKLGDYLTVPVGTFAVNFMCLGNFGKYYLGFNNSNTDYIVSPACQSFTLREDIDPDYFRYVVTRPEFQRRCVFYGDGNTRGGINITDFQAIDIPIPPIEIQKVISSIFFQYDNRRMINEKLKMQIRKTCPVLIKGSLEKANK